MCRKPDLTHLHLDEAERVVFLHEGLDAGAGILQTGLVLADPGDVFLNGRPVGVTVRVCAFPQSAGEGEDRHLHVLTQTGQDPLAVLHVLLQEEISEEGRQRQQLPPPHRHTLFCLSFSFCSWCFFSAMLYFLSTLYSCLSRLPW